VKEKDSQNGREGKGKWRGKNRKRGAEMKLVPQT
jgi:hypothetical protein